MGVGGIGVTGSVIGFCRYSLGSSLRVTERYPKETDMRIEVRLERLIMDAFPSITEEESPAVGGVPVEVWSGKLANLVVAILKETKPSYRSYQD